MTRVTRVPEGPLHARRTDAWTTLAQCAACRLRYARKTRLNGEIAHRAATQT